MIREDCVSRGAILSYIVNELGFGDEENGYDLERKIAQEEIYNFVEKMPYITPKEKTGKWITEYEIIKHDSYEEHNPRTKCSICNAEYDTYISHFMVYCPNCGAKMVELQESEE